MVSNIWIIFHNIIWDVILPIDFHNTFIFFRGVGQPPTSEPSTQCSHQSTSLPLTKRPAGVHGGKTNGATAGIAEETTPSKFCENWALAKGAVSRRDFLLSIPECNEELLSFWLFQPFSLCFCWNVLDVLQLCFVSVITHVSIFSERSGGCLKAG